VIVAPDVAVEIVHTLAPDMCLQQVKMRADCTVSPGFEAPIHAISVNLLSSILYPIGIVVGESSYL